jgi:hypothetical protein
MKVATVPTPSPRCVLWAHVRDDVSVYQQAQRIDGARGVQLTGRHVLIGDQIDFLAGTGDSLAAARGLYQNMARSLS